MSDVLRCPVCSCALFLVHDAHETAGAARIRHSLRPLNWRGRNDLQNFGRDAPRECEAVSTISIVVPAHAGTQYPETPMIEPRSRGVLDHPPSRVTTVECG